LSISVNVDETNITFEFKDSLRFLLKSIDKSATVLYKNNNGGLNNFKNLASFFREKYAEIMDDILELLVRKDLFPYEYLDSFEILCKKAKNLLVPSLKFFFVLKLLRGGQTFLFKKGMFVSIAANRKKIFFSSFK
jgi:hypothetical protein